MQKIFYKVHLVSWIILLILFISEAFFMFFAGKYSLLTSVGTVIADILVFFTPLYIVFLINGFIGGKLISSLINISVTIILILFYLSPKGPCLSLLNNDKIYYFIINDPEARKIADFSLYTNNRDKIPFIIRAFEDNARNHYYIESSKLKNEICNKKWEDLNQEFKEWFNNKSIDNIKNGEKPPLKSILHFKSDRGITFPIKYGDKNENLSFDINDKF